MQPLVIEHLQGGGKWTAFGLLTPKAVKDRTYLRDEITVDGQLADTHGAAPYSLRPP